MKFSNLSTTNIKGDVYGGLTAAIVALPLALAFGVSSGAGPIAGIYGAIFVGFFAALFGGTRTQISGPTGPMTVVMAAILTSSAASGVAYAFLVVILSGVLQIFFGVFKWGRYIRLMPFSVISGFMSGIGVIIILIQLNQLVGLAVVNDPVNAFLGIGALFSGVNLIALVVGVMSLVIMFFTPRQINQILPAPLIALIVCTFIATFLLPYNSLPVLGEIPTGLPKLAIPQVDFSLLPEILANAFILALLGSIDSLLTSLVADSATNTQHDSNKELIGQGIGNIVAGFFAGLPGAGATMRTIVNINAGGVSPLSGIIHALVLFGIVAGAGSLAGYIPHAALAGILIKVGYDIVDWQSFKRISTTPASDTIIMFTVLLLTVFVDLITAVAVGLIMACVLLTKKLSDLQLDQMDMITHIDDLSHLPDEELEFIRSKLNGLFYFRLKGSLSFAAAKDMAINYQQQLSHDSVLLDFSEVIYLDHSTIRTIEDIINFTHQQKVSIAIYCANKNIAQILYTQASKQTNISQLIFDKRIDALQHLAGQKYKSETYQPKR